MDKESILRMAMESANGILAYDAEGEWRLSAAETERFAALVVAAEREAWAKRLEAIGCEYCAVNMRLREKE